MEIDQIMELPSGDELREGLADHSDLAGLLSVVEQHIETAAAADDETVTAEVFTRLTEMHDVIVSIQADRAAAAEAEKVEAAELAARKAEALALLKSQTPAVEEQETVVEPAAEEAEFATETIEPEPAAEVEPVKKDVTPADMFNANTSQTAAPATFDTFDPLGRDKYQIGTIQTTRDAEALSGSHGFRVEAGDEVDSREKLTKVFTNALHSTTKSGRFAGSRSVPLVTSSWSHGEFTITEDMTEQAQRQIVSQIVDAHKAQATGNTTRSALVASCSDFDTCCPIPPLDTMRDIIRCSGVIPSTWRDSLPTINVQSTGGLRWMREPDWRNARAAIGSVTAAENCAGYGSSIDGTIPEGGAAFKTEHCVRVPCPTVHDVCVDEIFACVIIDNLQGRVWPELVDLFLDHLDIAWNERIEAKIANAIDTASTPVLAQNRDLDTWRNYHEALRKTRAGFEYRWHLPRGERLEIHMPEWMIDKIAVGLVNDHSNGYGERLFDNADEAVIGALRSIGYEPYTYRDDVVAASGDPRNQILGVDGVPCIINTDGSYGLVDFPEYEVSYIYPSGTFAYLDGGMFDSGVYRDHSLNGTNDAAIYRTEHMEIAQLGPESVMLVTQSDPCGKAAPAGSCDMTPIDPADVPGGVADWAEFGPAYVDAKVLADAAGDDDPADPPAVP